MVCMVAPRARHCAAADAARYKRNGYGTMAYPYLTYLTQ
jgi:hypothetical protein